MSLLVVLPAVAPLVGAVACLGASPWPRVQRAVALSTSAFLLGVALLLLQRTADGTLVVAHLGGWPAPHGIVFVADVLAALMVGVTGLAGTAGLVMIALTADAPTERLGLYPLLLVLLGGVCGAFLTGDVFNLYVWFEVVLIASFVLLALGGGRARLEGAMKYVVLNLMASAVLLAGVGLLYGVAGTVNMADLHVRLADVDARAVTPIAVLFLVAFGIKAGLFPLFFWLPASYPLLPAAVGAIFAGLLTKVGVYALVRVFTLVFARDPDFTHTLLLAASALTMMTGVLGALAQDEVRRILSFHVISQIGFMVMGLALFTPLALAGAVFYIVHHVVVKTNLFLIGGLVHRLRGTLQLGRLGGLWSVRPFLGILFLVPALSLAGVPPLSGFWAKLVLLRAGLDAGAYAVVAVALATSLLTLVSMGKVWNEAFWKRPPVATPPSPMNSPTWPLHAPVVLLALVTLGIGLWPAPLLDLSVLAGRQLLDPGGYVAAVLGGDAP